MARNTSTPPSDATDLLDVTSYKKPNGRLGNFSNGKKRDDNRSYFLGKDDYIRTKEKKSECIMFHACWTHHLDFINTVVVIYDSSHFPFPLVR